MSLNRVAGVVTIPEDSDVPGDDSCSAGNVHVRNLTFDYDDGTRALTEITLDIAAGEHVAVVGTPCSPPVRVQFSMSCRTGWAQWWARVVIR
ncbi:hypothetical protein [Corynebacterium glyciniphilum]|uniref:hypothetical protein n=1 Tax=Corynebacterium glyciniphilum TaxID=1404244 RepID=UPI0011AB7ABF|nr:hypothetical protein [Corynebacterium glyciniphilum]